jgi:Arc/MetJ-type ribon-helix-helix transcriptional regulator
LKVEHTFLSPSQGNESAWGGRLLNPDDFLRYPLRHAGYQPARKPEIRLTHHCMPALFHNGIDPSLLPLRSSSSGFQDSYSSSHLTIGDPILSPLVLPPKSTSSLRVLFATLGNDSIE